LRRPGRNLTGFFSMPWIRREVARVAAHGSFSAITRHGHMDPSPRVTHLKAVEAAAKSVSESRWLVIN